MAAWSDPLAQVHQGRPRDPGRDRHPGPVAAGRTAGRLHVRPGPLVGVAPGDGRPRKPRRRPAARPWCPVAGLSARGLVVERGRLAVVQNCLAILSDRIQRHRRDKEIVDNIKQYSISWGHEQRG